MRLKRSMNLLKDFDYKIYYHPVKGNVVVDASAGRVQGC